MVLDMRKLFLLALLFLIPTYVAHAQEKNTDSYPTENKSDSVSSGGKGFIGWLSHLLTDVDTVYVSPNKYNLAFMLENSNWYEYYRFRSTGEENSQTLFFAPKMNYKIGGYFGWKWIFIGYSIDVKDLFNTRKEKSQRTEFGLSLYSAIAGCDLYYRKSGNSFQLRNIKDYLPENYSGNPNKDINGFSVNIKGLNAYWIFNHKRFSYPAAYSQSTNQRRNAGSFIAGIAFSEHEINFNPNKMPVEVANLLNESLRFRKIKYTDIGFNLGYSYNWVFARNCLANISLTPAIAYKKSQVDMENGEHPQADKINFDLITRAGITYNNSKYFVGASLVMHTYEYDSTNFELNNSFGTIRVYAGFNFFKKKEYKVKEKKR